MTADGYDVGRLGIEFLHQAIADSIIRGYDECYGPDALYPRDFGVDAEEPHMSLPERGSFNRACSGALSFPIVSSVVFAAKQPETKPRPERRTFRQ